MLVVFPEFFFCNIKTSHVSFLTIKQFIYAHVLWWKGICNSTDVIGIIGVINSGINSPDDVEMQIIETAAAAVDTRGNCTTTFCRAACWLSDTGGLDVVHTGHDTPKAPIMTSLRRVNAINLD